MPTPAVIARRWFEEIWNQRRVESIDDLLAPDGVGHMVTGDIRGPVEFRKVHAELLVAFPDQSVRIKAIAAEGENAFVHWLIEGTHQGQLLDIAPTGKKMTINGVTRFRIQDAKVVEGWDFWDAGGLLAYLRA